MGTFWPWLQLPGSHVQASSCSAQLNLWAFHLRLKPHSPGEQQASEKEDPASTPLCHFWKFILGPVLLYLFFLRDPSAECLGPPPCELPRQPAFCLCIRRFNQPQNKNILKNPNCPEHSLFPHHGCPDSCVHRICHARCYKWFRDEV